jgi:glutamate:Na+ symporter, ESS family
MLEWRPDLILTATFTLLLVLIAYQIKNRLPFFQRFCIPVAVIGGFSAALVLWFLKERHWVSVQFDTSLQAPAMIAFFTTIGLGGSFTLLKQGGKLLLIYLAICWVLVMAQDIFGASLAGLFGLNPIYGVMGGGVSLLGGHGTGAAFGSMAENIGFHDATTVALACATFGLIAGGLLGGPLASHLIKKHQLTIPHQPKTPIAPAFSDREANISLTSYQLIASAGLILVLMTLGFWVSQAFTRWSNLVLPTYVGAMFVAMIFRNLNDRFPLITLNTPAIDLIAELSLGFFLTQACMSLKIWDLYTLALPLAGILILQIVLLICIAKFVVFPSMGKNYDAAVICSGFLGHGAGAVPNAVANMDSVCNDYKSSSYKALLIVPLCGSVLIDIVGVPFHTWIINYIHWLTY